MVYKALYSWVIKFRALISRAAGRAGRRRQEAPTVPAKTPSRYVAAYIVYMGAMLARETVDPLRLEALRLPRDANMTRASPLTCN